MNKKEIIISAIDKRLNIFNEVDKLSSGIHDIHFRCGDKAIYEVIKDYEKLKDKVNNEPLLTSEIVVYDDNNYEVTIDFIYEYHLKPNVDFTLREKNGNRIYNNISGSFSTNHENFNEYMNALMFSESFMFAGHIDTKWVYNDEDRQVIIDFVKGEKMQSALKSFFDRLETIINNNCVQ